MIFILHGENTIQSRQRLVELMDQAKNQNKHIDRYEAKKMNYGQLEEVLHKTDLFGTERLVVIEGLHSLPRAKKTSELIALTAQSTTDLILWEQRALTATMLKAFPQAQTQEFKLSKKLFTWLDSLSGSKSQTQLIRSVQLLHEASEQEDIQFCFIILIRQVRLLVQVKDGVIPPGAPFMVTKLKKQAQSFEMSQLLKLHQALVKIDTDQKTSATAVNLSTALDLFLLNLYS